MSKRVSPIERVRADIDQLFASDRELGEVLEEVAHLGVRLLMQAALEAEVTEFLGWERYVRGERARPGRTVNDAVIAYGGALVDHPGRFGAVEALGLDEMLMVKR